MALKLKVDERRTLNFEVQIGGINYEELSGSLRLYIEGVELGFPAEVHANYISVEIPPLNDIMKLTLSDNVLIETKLELYGNGFYMDPWRGQFRVTNPVHIEAKIVDAEPSDELAEKHHISVKLKDESYEQIDIEPPERSKPKPGKKIIIDREEDESNAAQVKVEQKVKQMTSIVDRLLGEGRKPTARKKSVPKPTTESKKRVVRKAQPSKTIQQPKGEVTFNYIQEYLSSKGMKSEKAQEALMERAKHLCSESGNAEAEDVFEVIKKLVAPREEGMLYGKITQ